MASFPSHDTAMGGGTMCERRHRKAEHTEEWEQTSPLSARHIAGVMLAEKSGVECARGRYLWDFTLVISPISRHPKSAYASQGLWRGLYYRFVVLCLIATSSDLPRNTTH